MIEQRRRCAHACRRRLAASLVAGCAATPSKVDPFEPMNRALFQVHDAVDTAVMKPVAQAYIDVVPQLDPHGVSNFFNNIDDLFSAVNDLLQGKLDKLRQRHGPRDAQHRVRPRRPLRPRVDGRHRARQRGLRADVRRVGLHAGAVPVRAAVRPDDGARRQRASIVRLCVGPVGYIPDVPVRNTPLRRRRGRPSRAGAGDDAPRRHRGARPLPLHPQRLSADGAAICSTTASRRRNPRSPRMQRDSMLRRVARRAFVVLAAAVVRRGPGALRRRRPTPWSSASRRT